MPKPPPTWPSYRCTRRRDRGRACGRCCRGSSAAPWRRRASPACRARRRSGAIAPRVSSGTPEWRPTARSSSTTACAARERRCRRRRSAFSMIAGSVERPCSNSPGGGARIEHDRQFLDVERDQIGGVLGEIGIGREHRGDRLADIAHAVLRQDGLAIGLEALDPGQAEIDRRNVGDIVGRSRPRPRPAAPARRSCRSTGCGRARWAERTTRMCSYAGNDDIGREPAAAGDQRPVLQTAAPIGRSSDISVIACLAAAARTALMMF